MGFLAKKLGGLVFVTLEGFGESEPAAGVFTALQRTGCSLVRCRQGKLEDALVALQQMEGQAAGVTAPGQDRSGSSLSGRLGSWRQRRRNLLTAIRPNPRTTVLGASILRQAGPKGRRREYATTRWHD